MRQTPRAQNRQGGNALAQPRGIPAEDGIGLASVQAPAQSARQLQPRPGRTRPVHRQDGGGAVKLDLDVRAEVEGEPDVVTAPGRSRR